MVPHEGKVVTMRLPVMLCRRWLTTPTQPIAVDDVLAYLLVAKDLPPGESRIFEIGSPDVTTYGGMIRVTVHPGQTAEAQLRVA